MADLSITRIGMAEHEYPTPTRNILSEQERERAKRRIGSHTKGGEVRIGYRTEDGRSIMFLTESEKARVRNEELANKQLEIAERKARMMAGYRPAEVDSWAHKS